MTEIPDDIRKRAEVVAVGWLAHLGEFGEDAQPLSECIAIALMAERERCAKVAEDMPWHIDMSPDHVRSLSGRDVADAIRSPAKTVEPSP